MNIFFFQNGDGVSSLWADCVGTASVALPADEANLLSSALQDYPVRYNLFDHVENRHVLFNLPQDPTTFILVHALDELGITRMSFNVRDLVAVTSNCGGNRIKDTTVVYGSLYSDRLTKEDAAKITSFYGRTDDGSIINLITREIHTSDITLVPWFFCFKVKDSAIYYIVPNPNTVQIVDLVESDVDSENKIFYLDSHMGSFNDFIFSPKVNKRAKVINKTNIMLTGDTLSIDPFGGWFAKSKLPGFFDPRQVKCTSSYNFVKDEKGIHFNINSPHGYIILRWNTVSAMDYKFMRSNRFYREFVVTQIKE